MNRGIVKVLIVTGATVVAASFLLVAFHGARVRGRTTHCRNNLRYLGERTIELLREERLNEESPGAARGVGQAFWRRLAEVKLKGKKLDVSPFACPFVAGDLVPFDGGPSFVVTYRGPGKDPLANEGEFALGADGENDHEGRPIHVLVVKLEAARKRGQEGELTGQIRIVEATPGDPAWAAAQAGTAD